MKISIIILTYNRKDLLSELLHSLDIITYPHLEVIIVDNHSEDRTDELVRKTFPHFIYIRTEHNLGVAARNLGIKIAKGNLLICLDDDVFGINDSSIKRLKELFKSDDNIGAINFQITHYESGELCNWVHHCSPENFSDKSFLTYEISEGAVAFRKSALKKTGLYPENFFLSHEGPDLAFRLIDNGYKVIYSGDIVVRHRFSELGRSTWYNYYYDTRNHVWVAIRNFPIPYLIRYLIRSLGSTFIYSIRDGYLRYWFKAIYDGISGLPSIMKDRRVLSNVTMKVINEIDHMRPSFISILRKKLFTRGMRELGTKRS